MVGVTGSIPVVPTICFSDILRIHGVTSVGCTACRGIASCSIARGERPGVGADCCIAHHDAQPRTIWHDDLTVTMWDALFEHVFGEDVVGHIELAAQRDPRRGRDQMSACGKADAALP